MDAWKTFSFLFWDSTLLSGAFAVSSREPIGQKKDVFSFVLPNVTFCLRRFVCQLIAFAKAPPWPWLIGSCQVPGGCWLCFVSCFLLVLLTKTHQLLGGETSNILYFHPECLEKWFPIWRAIFSNGLVQPPLDWIIKAFTAKHHSLLLVI